MRKIFVLAFFVSLLSAGLRAQNAPAKTPEDYGFGLPLNIPIFFSANYGEPRPNHFHSGIDIKTQGVTGKPVQTIADGYVARIMVSPYGFGKALYINHPNGYTSVYGHVERFAPEIEKYVYEQQYQRKSFTVDLYPPKEMFTYKRGDRVAFSGNRGSSGGPHLHLEVRETGSQHPLNMVARGMLEVAVTIPPKPITLYYVTVDTVQGIPVHTTRLELSARRKPGNNYVLSDTAALRLSGPGYFALEISERKNGTANPMGVYKINASIDGTPYFGMEIDRVGFDISRYVNAAILYKEARSKRNGVYKLHKLPNNPLHIYNGVKNKGLIAPADNKRHKIKVDMEDDCGNRSTLSFDVVKGGRATSPQPKGYPVKWDEGFRYNENGLQAAIPPRSLYESTFIDISTGERPSYGYSPLYSVSTSDEPLQSNITVSIDAKGLPENLRSKALLGTASGKNRSSAGGQWANGRVEGKTRSFGNFYIAVDTVAPRIVPKFKNGDNFSGKKSISLTISDDFSGIDSYTASIDGLWALFEYDPKTNRLTHYFDDARWPKSGTHNLTVTVRDGKGHAKTFKGNYIR